MKKKTKKVISSKNQPTRLNLSSWLAIVLACEYWHAPVWLKSIVYFLIGLFIMITIHLMVSTEEVETDIFDGDKPAK